MTEGTVYLTESDVLLVLSRAEFQARDLGLLLSAVGRPAASAFGEDAYPTLWLKAAAQLESLARNHGVVEGNKRTALRLTALFLQLNGWSWRPDPANEDFVVGVATGAIELAESARWLRDHSGRVTRAGDSSS